MIALIQTLYKTVNDRESEGGDSAEITFQILTMRNLILRVVWVTVIHL